MAAGAANDTGRVDHVGFHNRRAGSAACFRRRMPSVFGNSDESALACRDCVHNSRTADRRRPRGARAPARPITLSVQNSAENPKGRGVSPAESIMKTIPSWAAGWPIGADGGWRGRRYRKG